MIQALHLTMKGNLSRIIKDGNKDIKTTLDPTDVYITEQIPVAEEVIEVKQNTPMYWQPYNLGTTRPLNFQFRLQLYKAIPATYIATVCWSQNRRLLCSIFI